MKNSISFLSLLFFLILSFSISEGNGRMVTAASGTTTCPFTYTNTGKGAYSIVVTQATIDSAPIDSGDCIEADPGNNVPGYTSGNTIKFKIWDVSATVVCSSTVATFITGNGTFGNGIMAVVSSLNAITNTAPTAAFSVSPLTGTTETIFNFDASGSSDSEDSILSLVVRWDWENDGTWDTAYSTTKTAAYQFVTPGTYTIKAEVKDSGGLVDTKTLIVSVYAPPGQPVPIALVSDTGTVIHSDINTSLSVKFEHGSVSGKTVTLTSFGTSIADSVHSGPVFSKVIAYYSIEAAHMPA